MSNFKTKETVIIQNAANQSVENLIKRGNFALEDKNWKVANSFFEQALNQNPECAEAYLGKLMVEFSISQKEDLANAKKDFSESLNWKRILKYSDEILVVELTEYLNTAKEKIEINTATKKMKNQKVLKIVSVISGITVSIALISLFYWFVIRPTAIYNEAEKLYNEKQYLDAYCKYYVLDVNYNFKDSAKKAELSHKMYVESFWITAGDIVIQTDYFLNDYIHRQGDDIIISQNNFLTVNKFVGLISVVDGCVIDSNFVVTTPSNSTIKFSKDDNVVKVLTKKATDSWVPYYWSEYNIIEFQKGTSKISGSYIKNGRSISFSINFTVE